MRLNRGFTLAELIVLIAILVLAACLITPTLAQVRGPDSQKQRSTANLRLHGQVLALYANTHQGAVLNPFEGRLHLHWAVCPEWSNGCYTMKHDAYAYHWAPLIRQYYEDYESIDVFAAPGDSETVDTIQALYADGNGEYWVTNISYWYSPTMFFDAARFIDADGGDTLTGAVLDQLRHNDMADMRFPSRKVVLLEKQDFTTPEKLLFSHPEARVGLLLGDGSVSESDNPPLYDAIAADSTLAPSGGNWADEEALPYYWMGNDQSPDELLEDQQHLYPAFYMWTRDGIQGRDLF